MQLFFSIQKLFASYTKVRGEITIEKMLHGDILLIYQIHYFFNTEIISSCLMTSNNCWFLIQKYQDQKQLKKGFEDKFQKNQKYMLHGDIQKIYQTNYIQLSFSIQKLFASYTKVRGEITIEKQDFETNKNQKCYMGTFCL